MEIPELPSWVWMLLAFLLLRTITNYFAPQIPHVDTTNLADKIYHVDSAADLQQLLATTTCVVVDFYADWCGPCKQIAPFYQKLAADHSADGRLAFAKVNVDRAQDAARLHGVTAMPTFMFFVDGRPVSVEGNSVVRGADAPRLRAAVEKLAGMAGVVRS